tara:strand:- start:184 stop:384 length:201 start_codon:yes stop_codon:yes gene_type:complete
MKPNPPNYKSDLKEIKFAISELADIVGEIKNKLIEVNGKVDNVNQLSIFNNPNVSYTRGFLHEEEQ